MKCLVTITQTGVGWVLNRGCLLTRSVLTRRGAPRQMRQETLMSQAALEVL